MNPEPVLICVEGTIAAGKTTVLSSIDSLWEIRVEPVKQWESELNAFYSNSTNENAFSLQMKVFQAMKDREQTKTDLPVVVIERSILSGYYVFSNMMHSTGIMGNSELYNCEEEFEQIINGGYPQIDLMIFMQAPRLEVQLERIEARGRAAESGKITGEYLISLNKAYNQFVAGATKNQIAELEKTSILTVIDQGAVGREVMCNAVKEVVGFWFSNRSFEKYDGELPLFSDGKRSAVLYLDFLANR